MNKILIEIDIPAAGKNFDMFVPLHLKMSEFTSMICKEAVAMSDGLFVPNSDTAVCDATEGTILNVNMSIGELGLKNGSRLMII